jgi:hypothetical protein
MTINQDTQTPIVSCTTGLLILAALAGMLTDCATAGSQQTGDSEGITIQPFEEYSGGAHTPGASCKVGFVVTYPLETPKHERIIRYRYGYALSKHDPAVGWSGGGPIELPRPERDPRARPRGDGTAVFRATVTTFSPCVSKSGETATFELFLGDCSSGHCPPMRYREPEGVTVSEFRVADR